MKKYYLFLLFILINTAFAVVPTRLLPPKYLSVSEWKACVSTKKTGSAYFVCLPKNKPNTCPVSSWEALQKGPLIPYCR